MYEPDTTVTDNIYALGNAWIDFGDMLWEKMAAMDSSVQGVQWSGDAHEIAVTWAWGLLREGKFKPAVQHAWDVGNAINAYGDFIKEVQAKELHAARMQAIKLMLVTLLPLLAVVALAVLLPLGTILAALTSVLEAMGVVMEGIAVAAAYAGAIAIDVILNVVVQLGADIGAQALAAAVTHTDMPDFGSKEWWKHEALNLGLAGAGSLLAPGLKGLGALRRGVGDLTRGPKLAPPKFGPSNSFSPKAGLGHLDGKVVNKMPDVPGGTLPNRNNLLPPKADTVRPGGGLPRTEIPLNAEPHPPVGPPRESGGSVPPRNEVVPPNGARSPGEVPHQPNAGPDATHGPNPSRTDPASAHVPTGRNAPPAKGTPLPEERPGGAPADRPEQHGPGTTPQKDAPTSSRTADEHAEMPPVTQVNERGAHNPGAPGKGVHHVGQEGLEKVPGRAHLDPVPPGRTPAADVPNANAPRQTPHDARTGDLMPHGAKGTDTTGAPGTAKNQDLTGNPGNAKAQDLTGTPGNQKAQDVTAPVTKDAKPVGENGRPQQTARPEPHAAAPEGKAPAEKSASVSHSGDRASFENKAAGDRTATGSSKELSKDLPARSEGNAAAKNEGHAAARSDGNAATRNNARAEGGQTQTKAPAERPENTSASAGGKGDRAHDAAAEGVHSGDRTQLSHTADDAVHPGPGTGEGAGAPHAGSGSGAGAAGRTEQSGAAAAKEADAAKEKAWAAESDALKKNTAERLSTAERVQKLASDEHFHEGGRKLQEKFTDTTGSSKALRSLDDVERQKVFDELVGDARAKFDELFGPFREGRDVRPEALAKAEQQWNKELDRLGDTVRGRAQLHKLQVKLDARIETKVAEARKQWRAEGHEPDLVDRSAKEYEEGLGHVAEATYGELKAKPHWQVSNKGQRFDQLAGQLRKGLPERLGRELEFHATAGKHLDAWQEFGAGLSAEERTALHDRYSRGTREAFGDLVDKEAAKLLAAKQRLRPLARLTAKEQQLAHDLAVKKWPVREEELLKRLDAEIQAGQDLRRFIDDLPTRQLDKGLPDGPHGPGRTELTDSVHASLKRDAEALLDDLRGKPLETGARDIERFTQDGLSKLNRSLDERFRFERGVQERWHAHQRPAGDLDAPGTQVRTWQNELRHHALADVRKGLGTDYSPTHVDDALNRLDASLTDIGKAAPELRAGAERLPEATAGAKAAWDELTAGRPGLHAPTADRMWSQFHQDWMSGHGRVWSDGRLDGIPWHAPERAPEVPYDAARAAEHQQARGRLLDHYETVVDMAGTQERHLSRLAEDVRRAAREWQPPHLRFEGAAHTAERAAEAARNAAGAARKAATAAQEAAGALERIAGKGGRGGAPGPKSLTAEERAAAPGRDTVPAGHEVGEAPHGDVAKVQEARGAARAAEDAAGAAREAAARAADATKAARKAAEALPDGKGGAAPSADAPAAARDAAAEAREAAGAAERAAARALDAAGGAGGAAAAARPAAAAAKDSGAHHFRDLIGRDTAWVPGADDIKAVVDDVGADLRREFDRLIELPEPGLAKNVDGDALHESLSRHHRQLIDELPTRFDRRYRDGDWYPTADKAVDDLLATPEFRRDPLPDDLVRTVKARYAQDLAAARKAGADGGAVGGVRERLDFARQAERQVDDLMKRYDIGGDTDLAGRNVTRDEWRRTTREQLLDTYRDMRELHAAGVEAREASDLVLNGAARKLEEQLRIERQLPGLRKQLDEVAFRHDVDDAVAEAAGRSLEKDLKAAVDDAFGAYHAGAEADPHAAGRAAGHGRNSVAALTGERGLAGRLRYHEELNAHLRDLRTQADGKDLLLDPVTVERVHDKLAAELERLADTHLGEVRTGRSPLAGGELDPRVRQWRQDARAALDRFDAEAQIDEARQSATREAGEVFEATFGDGLIHHVPAHGKWSGDDGVAAAFRRDRVALDDHFRHPGADDLKTWLDAEKNGADDFQKGLDQARAQRQQPRPAPDLTEPQPKQSAPAGTRDTANVPVDKDAPHGSGRDLTGERTAPEQPRTPEHAQDGPGAQQQVAEAEPLERNSGRRTQEQNAGEIQEQAVQEQPAQGPGHTREQAHGSPEPHTAGSQGSDRLQPQLFVPEHPSPGRADELLRPWEYGEELHRRSWKYYDSHLRPDHWDRRFESTRQAGRLDEEFSSRFARGVRSGLTETAAAEAAGRAVGPAYERARAAWLKEQDLRSEVRAMLRQGPLAPDRGPAGGLITENDLTRGRHHWDERASQWYRAQLTRLTDAYVAAHTAPATDGQVRQTPQEWNRTVRAAAQRLSALAAPMAALVDRFTAYSRSYEFAPYSEWSAATEGWFRAEQHLVRAQAIEALERDPGALAEVQRTYAERMAVVRRGAELREHPELLDGAPAPATPVPAHGESDDWRTPVMHEAEQALRTAYDELLARESAEAAHRRQLRESVEEWARDGGRPLSPQQAEQLTDEMSRIREDGATPEELRESAEDRMTLERMRSRARALGRAAFDDAVRTWSRTLSAPGAASPAFVLDEELIARVAAAEWELFEKRLDVHVRMTFAAPADARGTRLSANRTAGIQQLRGLLAELPDALDLRALRVSELRRAGAEFDAAVAAFGDRPTEEQRALLASFGVRGTTLSEAGLDALRERHLAALDTAFSRNLRPDTVAAARGEDPEALARWRQAYAATTAELPVQLARQAAREAVLARTLTDVTAAAAELGGESEAARAFLRHFPALTPERALAAAVATVQHATATAVDAAFERALTGDAAKRTLAGWEATYAGLAGGDVLRSRLVAVAAKAAALAGAQQEFAEALAEWRAAHPGRTLTDEAAERAAAGFRERAAAGFDAAFAGAYSQVAEVSGGLVDWQLRCARLVETLDAHLRFEAEVPAALSAAGAAFDTLAGPHPLDETTRARLKARFTDALMTAYRRVWAPHDLASSWHHDDAEPASAAQSGSTAVDGFALGDGAFQEEFAAAQDTAQDTTQDMTVPHPVPSVSGLARPLTRSQAAQEELAAATDAVRRARAQHPEAPEHATSEELLTQVERRFTAAREKWHAALTDEAAVALRAARGDAEGAAAELRRASAARREALDGLAAADRAHRQARAVLWHEAYAYAELLRAGRNAASDTTDRAPDTDTRQQTAAAEPESAKRRLEQARTAERRQAARLRKAGQEAQRADLARTAAEEAWTAARQRLEAAALRAGLAPEQARTPAAPVLGEWLIPLPAPLAPAAASALTGAAPRPATAAAPSPVAVERALESAEDHVAASLGTAEEYAQAQSELQARLREYDALIGADRRARSAKQPVDRTALDDLDEALTAARARLDAASAVLRDAWMRRDQAERAAFAQLTAVEETLTAGAVAPQATTPSYADLFDGVAGVPQVQPPHQPFTAAPLTYADLFDGVAGASQVQPPHQPFTAAPLTYAQLFDGVSAAPQQPALTPGQGLQAVAPAPAQALVAQPDPVFLTTLVSRLQAPVVDAAALHAWLAGYARPADGFVLDAFDREFHALTAATLPRTVAGALVRNALGPADAVQVLQHFYGPAAQDDPWGIDLRYVAEGVPLERLPQVQAFALRLGLFLQAGLAHQALDMVRHLDRDLRTIWSVDDAFQELWQDSLRTAFRNHAAQIPEAQVRHVLGEVTRQEPASEAEAQAWYRQLTDLEYQHPQLGRRPLPNRHPEDGCYLRAHMIAMRLQQWNARVYKVIAARTGPLLGLETRNTEHAAQELGTTAVRWRYHIAAAVRVRAADGTDQLIVLDPALELGPLPVTRWLAEIGIDPQSGSQRFIGSLRQVRDQMAADQQQRPGLWHSVRNVLYPAAGRSVVVISEAAAYSYAALRHPQVDSLRNADAYHRGFGTTALDTHTDRHIHRTRLRAARDGVERDWGGDTAAAQQWAADTYDALRRDQLLDPGSVLALRLRRMLPAQHPDAAPAVVVTEQDLAQFLGLSTDEVLADTVWDLPAPLPQGPVFSRAVAEEPAGTIGGWLRNTGAAEREAALTRRFRTVIGPGTDGEGHHFSHSMLDRIEQVLTGLPRRDVEENPQLKAIIDDSSGTAASTYDYGDRTLRIARPFQMPSWMYTSLGRGNATLRWVMDLVAMSDYPGLTTAEILGLRGAPRHVMAGVSDVLARGNLVTWTLRHEVGHSVDARTRWAQEHATEDMFGGWQSYATDYELDEVARAFLALAEITAEQVEAVSGAGAFERLVGEVSSRIKPVGSDGPDPERIALIPRQLAGSDPELRGRLTTMTGLLRAAMAQPWTRDNGGAALLAHDGRIFQVDNQTGGWISYLAAARAHAVSNYQFSSAAEWFAEAYAAYHDPREIDPPRERLHPDVREWFRRAAEPPTLEVDPAHIGGAELTLTTSEGVAFDAADISNLVIVAPGSLLPTGRSYLVAGDVPERLLTHTDLDLTNLHFAHFAPEQQTGVPDGNGGQVVRYRVRASDLDTVPWKAGDPLYLALLHGEKGWLTVPVNGRPVRVSGTSFGRMLRRRDSVAALKARAGNKAWIVLAACEAAATDEAGDSVAQQIADATGMNVAAPTTKVAATPHVKEFSFLLYHDAQGNRGEWRTFTPRNAAAKALVPPAVIDVPRPVPRPDQALGQGLIEEAARSEDEAVRRPAVPLDRAALQDRLDTYARRDDWDQLRSHTLQPLPKGLTVGGSHSATAVVPQRLHFVWLGGRMPAGTLDNLRVWAEHAAASGWQLNLWLDDGARTAHDGLLTGDLAGIAVRGIDDATLFDRLPAEVRAPARDLVAFALSRGAYAVAADVVRYGVLWHQGGMYLDVDVAPGAFTLPTEELRLGTGLPDLPLLGPLLRDETSFTKIRNALLADGFAIGTSRAEQLESVARYRYARGDHGNGLIVTPPGTAFLTALLTHLPVIDVPPLAPGEDLAAWAMVHSGKLTRYQHLIDSGSAMTGPEYLVNVARRYAEGHDLPPGAQHRPLDPALRDRWLPLRWLADAGHTGAAGTAPAAERPLLAPKQQAELAYRLRPRRTLVDLVQLRPQQPLTLPEFLRAGDLVALHDALFPVARFGPGRSLSRLIALRRLTDLAEAGHAPRHLTPTVLDGLVRQVFPHTTVDAGSRRLLVAAAQDAKTRWQPLTPERLRQAGERHRAAGFIDVGVPQAQSPAAPVQVPGAPAAGPAQPPDLLDRWHTRRYHLAAVARGAGPATAASEIAERLRTAGPGATSLVRFAAARPPMRAVNVDGRVLWTEAGGSRWHADPAALLPAGPVTVDSIDVGADGRLLTAPPAPLGEDAGLFPELVADLDALRALAAAAPASGTLDLLPAAAMAEESADAYDDPDAELVRDVVHLTYELPGGPVAGAAGETAAEHGDASDDGTGLVEESVEEVYTLTRPAPVQAQQSLAFPAAQESRPYEELHVTFPEAPVPPVGFGVTAAAGRSAQFPLGLFGSVVAFGDTRFDGTVLPGGPPSGVLGDLVASLLPAADEIGAALHGRLASSVRAQLGAHLDRLGANNLSRRLVDGGLTLTVPGGSRRAGHTVRVRLTGIHRHRATPAASPYLPYGEKLIGPQEATTNRSTGSAENAGASAGLSAAVKVPPAPGGVPVTPKAGAGLSSSRSYDQSRSTNAYTNPSLGYSGELTHFTFGGVRLEVTTAGPGVPVRGRTRSREGALLVAFPTELTDPATNRTGTPWHATLPDAAPDALRRRFTQEVLRFFSVGQHIGGLGRLRDQVIDAYPTDARPGSPLHEYLHHRLGELSVLNDLARVLNGGMTLPPVPLGGGRTLQGGLAGQVTGVERIGDASTLPTVLNLRWLELQGASATTGGGFSVTAGGTTGPGTALPALQFPVTLDAGTSTSFSSAGDTGGGRWHSVRFNGRSVPFLLTVRLTAGVRPLGDRLGREFRETVAVVVRVPEELAGAFQDALGRIVADESLGRLPHAPLPLTYPPQADAPAPVIPHELTQPTGSSGLYGPVGLSALTRHGHHTDVREQLREQFLHERRSTGAPEWTAAELVALETFLDTHFHTQSLGARFTELFGDRDASAAPEEQGLRRTFLRPLADGGSEAVHFRVRAERVPAAPGEAVAPLSAVPLAQAGFDLWPSAMRDFANSRSNGSQLALGVGVTSGWGPHAGHGSEMKLFSRSHTAKQGLTSYGYLLSGLNYAGPAHQLTYRVRLVTSVTVRKVPAPGLTGAAHRLLRAVRPGPGSPAGRTAPARTIEGEARWLIPATEPAPAAPVTAPGPGPLTLTQHDRVLGVSGTAAVRGRALELLTAHGVPPHQARAHLETALTHDQLVAALHTGAGSAVTQVVLDGILTNRRVRLLFRAEITDVVDSGEPVTLSTMDLAEYSTGFSDVHSTTTNHLSHSHSATFSGGSGEMTGGLGYGLSLSPSKGRSLAEITNVSPGGFVARTALPHRPRTGRVVWHLTVQTKNVNRFGDWSPAVEQDQVEVAQGITFLTPQWPAAGPAEEWTVPDTLPVTALPPASVSERFLPSADEDALAAAQEHGHDLESPVTLTETVMTEVGALLAAHATAALDSQWTPQTPGTALPGTLDTILTPRTLHAMADAMAGAGTVLHTTVPGAGHTTHLQLVFRLHRDPEGRGAHFTHRLAPGTVSRYTQWNTRQELGRSRGTATGHSLTPAFPGGSASLSHTTSTSQSLSTSVLTRRHDGYTVSGTLATFRLDGVLEIGLHRSVVPSRGVTTLSLDLARRATHAFQAMSPGPVATGRVRLREEITFPLEQLPDQPPAARRPQPVANRLVTPHPDTDLARAARFAITASELSRRSVSVVVNPDAVRQLFDQVTAALRSYGAEPGDLVRAGQLSRDGLHRWFDPHVLTRHVQLHGLTATPAPVGPALRGPGGPFTDTTGVLSLAVLPAARGASLGWRPGTSERSDYGSQNNGMSSGTGLGQSLSAGWGQGVAPGEDGQAPVATASGALSLGHSAGQSVSGSGWAMSRVDGAAQTTLWHTHDFADAYVKVVLQGANERGALRYGGACLTLVFRVSDLLALRYSPEATLLGLGDVRRTAVPTPSGRFVPPRNAADRQDPLLLDLVRAQQIPAVPGVLLWRVRAVDDTTVLAYGERLTHEEFEAAYVHDEPAADPATAAYTVTWGETGPDGYVHVSVRVPAVDAADADAEEPDTPDVSLPVAAGQPVRNLAGALALPAEALPDLVALTERLGEVPYGLLSPGLTGRAAAGLVRLARELGTLPQALTEVAEAYRTTPQELMAAGARRWTGLVSQILRWPPVIGTDAAAERSRAGRDHAVTRVLRALFLGGPAAGHAVAEAVRRAQRAEDLAALPPQPQDRLTGERRTAFLAGGSASSSGGGSTSLQGTVTVPGPERFVAPPVEEFTQLLPQNVQAAQPRTITPRAAQATAPQAPAVPPRTLPAPAPRTRPAPAAQGRPAPAVQDQSQGRSQGQKSAAERTPDLRAPAPLPLANLGAAPAHTPGAAQDTAPAVPAPLVPLVVDQELVHGRLLVTRWVPAGAPEGAGAALGRLRYRIGSLDTEALTAEHPVAPLLATGGRGDGRPPRVLHLSGAVFWDDSDAPDVVRALVRRVAALAADGGVEPGADLVLVETNGAVLTPGTLAEYGFARLGDSALWHRTGTDLVTSMTGTPRPANLVVENCESAQ
ncbi:protein-glutamine glutaminase family protein [Streptomyces ramulosus]|uniref:Protein-glutamine glutaminase family protein n=1 Tax=Streptomyces ramulosus TaxID=47762 RepID=A0ABW1FQH6_9ACTN